MSYYEELVAVSRAWVNRQERLKADLESVIRRFVKHCGIPEDKVRYLRWDNDLQIYIARADEVFSFYQACHHYRDTGEWGVGVSISLGHSAMGSYAKVAFTVRLKAINEASSKLTFGELKPQTVKLHSNGWGDTLIPEAMESLKSGFENATNERPPIGFSLSTSLDPETSA
jgi:hypothetical protein